MKKNVVLCSLLIIVFGLLTGCSNPSGVGDSETGSITITLAASNARFAYPPSTADLAQMNGVLALTKDGGTSATHRFWGDKGLKLTGLAAGNYTLSLKVYYFFGDRIDNDNPPTEDGEHVLLAESAGSDPTLSFTLAAGENKTVPVTVYKKFTPAVEINPPAATVGYGKTARFNAFLATGTDLHLDDEFIWTMTGNSSAGTTINPDTGLLTVDPSETATTLTLTTASKSYPTIIKTATITLQTATAFPTNLVNISGDSALPSGDTVMVNAALTAQYTGATPGTISYQWKRGADNIGTDSDRYILTAQDAGHAISVEVEHSAYSTKGAASLTVPDNKIAVTSNTHWENLAAVMNAMPTNTNYEVHVTGYHNGGGYTSNTFGTKQNITVDIKGTVTNGENSQINLAGQGSLLYIGANQTVVMDNLNLVGNAENNTSLVYITGTNAAFTMNSGKVSGNTIVSARSGGGGVYLISGTFTMTDGEISGNTILSASNGGGGGVSINNGTFTMTGGAISGNTIVSASSGGGVAVNGIFTMTGGEISGNTANGRGDNGGGVFVSNNSGSIFYISKGIVYGSGEGDKSNSATGSPRGAALYKYSYGTAELGTFADPDDVTSTWNSAGTLGSTNDTIRVVNGVLQP